MTTNKEAIYAYYTSAAHALGVTPQPETPTISDAKIRALYESADPDELYPPGTSHGFTLTVRSLAAGALWDESDWCRQVARARVAALLATRPDPGEVQHTESPATNPLPSFDDFNASRHGGAS